MKFETRMLICFGGALVGLLPIDLFLFQILSDEAFQVIGSLLGLTAGVSALLICLHWEERDDAKRSH